MRFANVRERRLSPSAHVTRQLTLRALRTRVMPATVQMLMLRQERCEP